MFRLENRQFGEQCHYHLGKLTLGDLHFYYEYPQCRIRLARGCLGFPFFPRFEASPLRVKTQPQQRSEKPTKSRSPISEFSVTLINN